VLVRWDAWRAAHPQTLVLAKRADAPGNPTVDGYADRTAGLELGLSVEIGRSVRIYPFERLAQVSLAEDTVEDTPVVVALDPAAASAFAYDRRLGDEVLQLRLERSRGGPALLRDNSGDRAWNLLSGRPSRPGAAYPPLRRVPATTWERTAWTRQHPHGSIWQGD
jgi:hypothetical protein